MKRKPIPKQTMIEINKWIKNIYNEADDLELPEILLDEFWGRGFEAGEKSALRKFGAVIDNHFKDFKSSLYKKIKEQQ